jgi:two-component system sensor histidine kinase CpxA
MIRLVLKIFIAYWIAAGLVTFIIFEPHRDLHSTELSNAFKGLIAMDGRLIAEEYEAGRCPAVQKLLITKSEGLSLTTSDGKFLCGDPDISDEKSLVQEAVRTGKRRMANHALFQAVAVPVTPGNSNGFVLLFKKSYSSPLRAYGLMPGYAAIGISCVVTLFLALLLALPIRRLRTAAQRIAMGKLDARVSWGGLSDKIYGFNGRDDIARLVQDFNYMAERLQALAESQRLLLRDVSHELRSPLARLTVGLSLARREAPAAMRDHLDRIESETQRLNDLIGQILSLSYLETIQKIEVPSDISLSELVVDLLPDIQYEAAQSGCAITTTISPGCNVRGDSELLRAGVENIVRNAIRYVPDSGLIHVETIPVERDGKMLSVVRISDNGPGIPETELELVLEPFYRADKSRHWQKAGFGIGLAIANRAANVHGGTIHIHNRPEGGLMVEMCFPLTLGIA